MQQGTQVGDNGGAATSPAATGATGTATTRSHVNGGRFDFDDGGTYCGGWEEGKAHGHGVCTGPKGQGAYSGSWHYGFEVSGVYTWPSGSCFEGQWQNGKRHGLGVETRGRWIYRGEWTQGFKGRYGVRQSNTSTAKYEGTWANGLQDGYGSETYADDGTYQGQWMRGMRHGYGIRKSAPFGKASKYRANKTLRASLTSLRSNEGQSSGNPEPSDKRDRRVDDSRGGFVLYKNSTEPTVRRRSLGSGNIKKGIFNGLKIKKQKSTGDLDKRGAGSGSIRSTGSSASWVSTDSGQSAMTNASIPSDSNASFVIEDETMDPSVTETYMGEWKNDKRSGYGISERSDGLKYEGEWYANKKYGYGVTTFNNGEKEEGKYKNNVLITSQKKKLFLMRSAKFRERIDAAVNAAQRASKIALQKSDIAINRTATARGKAEQADMAAAQAREDSDIAESVAKQYAPDFRQPGLERLKERRNKYPDMHKYSPNLVEINLEKKETPSVNFNPNPVSNTYPNSNPYPNSTSNPYANPASNVYPNPTSNPYPNPTSNPYPNPTSNPYPNPTSNPYPNPTPNPYPNPTSNPYPNPTSNSYLNPTSNPYSNPNPHPYANPTSNPNSPGPNLLENTIPNHTPTIPNNIGNKPGNKPLTPNIPNQIPYSQPQLRNNPSYAHEQKLPGSNPPYGWSSDSYNNPNNPTMQPHMNEIGPKVTQNTNENNPGNDYSYKPRGSLVEDHPRRISRATLGTIGPQTSKEYLEQYMRPPSRDTSVDRYTKATGRLTNAMNSRQPSVDRTSANLRPSETPDRTLRAPSAVRGTTPAPAPTNSMGARNGSVMTGNPTKPVASNPASVQSPPFEEIIIRKRGLGQDIIPSPNQPKRTESLFNPGHPTPPVAKNLVTQTSLQRKKSLPDVQDLPRSSGAMSREEVSYLGSARREEIRRQHDEHERLRANPLLYLVSPQVKDWFSRQQLVLVVLFVNISLAIMFFKLLT